MGNSEKWVVHDFGPEAEGESMGTANPSGMAIDSRSDSRPGENGLLTFLEYVAIGAGGTFVVVLVFFLMSWLARTVGHAGTQAQVSLHDNEELSDETVSDSLPQQRSNLRLLKEIRVVVHPGNRLCLGVPS